MHIWDCFLENCLNKGTIVVELLAGECITHGQRKFIVVAITLEHSLQTWLGMGWDKGMGARRLGLRQLGLKLWGRCLHCIGYDLDLLVIQLAIRLGRGFTIWKIVSFTLIWDYLAFSCGAIKRYSYDIRLRLWLLLLLLLVVSYYMVYRHSIASIILGVIDSVMEWCCHHHQPSWRRCGFWCYCCYWWLTMCKGEISCAAERWNNVFINWCWNYLVA